MGYRSDVSVVFYTRNTEETPFSVIKLWFDENYPRKDAVEEWGAEISVGPYWVMVTYEDVKWYEGYTHPNAVRATLDSFDKCFGAQDFDRTAWEMIRIGEQTDDIDQQHSAFCDYLLGVRREIVFG